MAADLPAGACDCHFHVFDAARHAYAPQRHYTPPDATLADYLAMCARNGIHRSVLVHPTVFGGDHRSFEDILGLHPGRIRGVAVVAPDTPDEDIARWHALGARGTRITTIFDGGPDLATIERVVAKVAPFGWHLQLLVDVFRPAARATPTCNAWPQPSPGPTAARWCGAPTGRIRAARTRSRPTPSWSRWCPSGWPTPACAKRCW